METATATVTEPRTSVFKLVRALTGDTKTFIRQELQLAKTEIAEKISSLGRNTTSLAIGGFVAYAGLIVFLIGLGVLLTYAFEASGLSRLVAGFIGLAVIGLLVMILGGAFIFKAMGSLKKQTLAPKRTMHTLQELKARQHTEFSDTQDSEEYHPSSEEMQARVEATEDRMGETLDELGYRLSPSHINQQVKHRIQANPYRFSLIAMGAGFLSVLLFRAKRQA